MCPPDTGSAPNVVFTRSDGVRTGNDLYQQEQAAAIGIVAANVDYHDTEVATALTARRLLNGGNQPSADLPMNSFKHTGVAVASARTNYTAASQVQDSSLTFSGTSAGTDTITATLTPAITAYVAGQRYHFIAGGTNTGAATLNINSISAIALKKGADAAVALAAGDITTGGMYIVVYTGTVFHLINPKFPDGFATTDTPLFTGVNIGNADTTVSRASAGDINIEGNIAYRAGGTDVAIADGGTGASTAANAFAALKQNATTAATGVVQLADQAAQEASTAGRAVTSDVQRLHPTAAKGWVQWDGNSSSVGASFGVTSITDNGTGDFTANWSTVFSSANYAAAALNGGIAGSNRVYMSVNPAAAPTASAFRVIFYNDAGNTVDGTWAGLVGLGDL